MTKEATNILRHIIDARIDHAENRDIYITLRSIKDCLEYALEDNIDCLKEFDYLNTADEEIEDSRAGAKFMKKRLTF